MRLHCSFHSNIFKYRGSWDENQFLARSFFVVVYTHSYINNIQTCAPSYILRLKPSHFCGFLHKPLWSDFLIIKLRNKSKPFNQRINQPYNCCVCERERVSEWAHIESDSDKMKCHLSCLMHKQEQCTTCMHIFHLITSIKCWHHLTNEH